MRSQLEQVPFLLVDTGNFTGSPSERGEAQTRTLIAAMDRLGYRYVNVGERDVRQGYESIAERIRDASFEVISANLLYLDDQTPVFTPHVIAEIPAPGDGRTVRLGIVGAMRFNPIFRKPGPAEREMFIAHPEQPVQQAVAALREADVDLIVLLAAMNRDDVQRLVETTPGIDLVLGAYAGAHDSKLARSGDTSILYLGDRGQRLGEARVFLPAGDRMARQTGRTHLLGPHIPADQEMLQFVETTRSAPPSSGATASAGQ
jgi:2',3'-cyclic-nucleotide 2'-phosphodiesterase (5'-nucleotidase family)